MPYITVSNAAKVLASIDFAKVLVEEGSIYKKPIYFFSTREKQQLLGLRELYSNPKNFMLEYYKPMVTEEDTFTYIYEGGQAAYHSSRDCVRLKSNFKNFPIPNEIKEKGKEAIIEFREWFKSVQDVFNEKPDAFEMRLNLKYGIRFNVKSIEHSNSGIETKENLNLQELEQKIDKLLNEAGKFYKQQDKFYQNIISRFAKISFLAYSNKEIQSNDSGLTDDKLKSFLRSYDTDFKKPVKYLLREYYRVLHNPDLKFEGQLLEVLGFKPCGNCHKNNLEDILKVVGRFNK